MIQAIKHSLDNIDDVIGDAAQYLLLHGICICCVVKEFGIVLFNDFKAGVDSFELAKFVALAGSFASLGAADTRGAASARRED